MDIDTNRRGSWPCVVCVRMRRRVRAPPRALDVMPNAGHKVFRRVHGKKFRGEEKRSQPFDISAVIPAQNVREAFQFLKHHHGMLTKR